MMARREPLPQHAFAHHTSWPNQGRTARSRCDGQWYHCGVHQARPDLQVGSARSGSEHSGTTAHPREARGEMGTRAASAADSVGNSKRTRAARGEVGSRARCSTSGAPRKGHALLKTSFMEGRTELAACFVGRRWACCAARLATGLVGYSCACCTARRRRRKQQQRRDGRQLHQCCCWCVKLLNMRARIVTTSYTLSSYFSKECNWDSQAVPRRERGLSLASASACAWERRADP